MCCAEQTGQEKGRHLNRSGGVKTGDSNVFDAICFALSEDLDKISMKNKSSDSSGKSQTSTCVTRYELDEFFWLTAVVSLVFKEGTTVHTVVCSCVW